MIQRTAVIFVFLFVAVSHSLGNESRGLKPVSAQDIETAIEKSILKHPYLYFSEKEKPALRERIEKEPVCRDIMERLLAEANRLLFTPVDPILPEKPGVPVYDNTWPREHYIINNIGAAYTLAFTYQMTGDEKYAKKAFEFIDVVCDLPTWVHGYHEFPIFYDRVWPWGVSDDQVVFSYAQWSDHVVLRVAAVYDLLYTALDRCQRDRIRSALLEKAILRVRGNYEYHWWATAYRCNWCTVCNSSLGVAAITLLTEDPDLTDVIAESYNRIGKTFDQIKDGGWQEGISYLYYMVNTTTPFADALKRITSGRYNLYKHPRLENAVNTFIYCQIPPDKVVHFSDCSGGMVGSYNFYNTLMLETGSRKAAWLRKHFTDEQPSSFTDLFKPRCILEPELPQETSKHFHAVDWVIMRSDFTDTEKVVLAAKSGKNDDPHHGHLDVGHFSLYWRGEEFICDNGSAVQDKLYFFKERWGYPHASSAGHNVVFVNGEKQLPCKLKNQPWNENIGGRIVEFRPGYNRDYVLMNPTNAYPKKELKKWHRHIILDKPVVTVVLDEVVCDKGAEIEVRFHSPVTTVYGVEYVLLKSDNSNMVLIPVVDGDFTVRPGKHAILPVDKNSRFRWIPFFGIVMKALSAKNIIGTIIVPVKKESEACEIVKTVNRDFDYNGNISISFIRNGKTYIYNFKNWNDGLKLE